MEKAKKRYHAMRIVIDQELVACVVDEWSASHTDALYDINTKREEMSAALRRTRAYHLRSSVIAPADVVHTESTKDILDCKDTALFDSFPKLRELIRQVGLVHSDGAGWQCLGRVFVTRLDANQVIGRHTDSGHYFDVLHRFHLVLKSEGSSFCWDGRSQTLRKGEVWMVNNSVPHWVANGKEDRTHVIFDAV